MNKKVLIIVGSIFDQNSLTWHNAKYFANEYKKINPNDEVEIFDLSKEEELNQILTPSTFNDFWNSNAKKYIEKLKNIDKLVIATMMINFTIPTLLKNFLDKILLAKETFRYKYDGDGLSEGLLTNIKKVFLILSQGAIVNWYPQSAFDGYLEHVFNFVGVHNIDKMIFDGTKTKNESSLSIEEKFNLFKEQFDEKIKKF